MIRLRNSKTGVVVNVDADTAERLGSDWKPTESKKAPAKKAAPSKKSD